MAKLGTSYYNDLNRESRHVNAFHGHNVGSGKKVNLDDKQCYSQDSHSYERRFYLLYHEIYI
jgi:hypothetical protein